MDSVSITILVIFLVIAIPVFVLTKINKDKLDAMKNNRQNKRNNRKKK